METQRSSKKWSRSKTIWFNVLTTLVAVLSGIAGLLPTLELVIPSGVYAIMFFAIGVTNIVLRSVTNGPIFYKEPKNELEHS